MTKRTNKHDSIFDEVEKLRKLAKNTIDKTTKKRKLEGWIFIHHRKNNTSKQVHPDKLEGYLLEGWSITKNEIK